MYGMDNSTLLSQNLVPQLADYLSETPERLSPVLDLIETHLSKALSRQASSPIGYAVIRGQLNENIFQEITANADLLADLAALGDRIMGRMLPGQKSGMVSEVMQQAKMRIPTAMFLICVSVCCFVKHLGAQIEANNWDDAALRVHLLGTRTEYA